MKVPKIIHQIWSGVDEPLPEYFATLGETWKRDYPGWEYILWDNKMMTDFIEAYYPQYMQKYESFRYNIQRWDAIRYLILDKMGGMYVDFDYESVEPMDELLADKTCCFSTEPDYHRQFYIKPYNDIFNNAMMLSVPGHFFIKKIIKTVFGEKDLSKINASRFHNVLYTTGPGILVELYCGLTTEEKESIYLIPYKYVTPFDQKQARKLLLGEVSDELEDYIRDAYAVHYFFSNWSKPDA